MTYYDHHPNEDFSHESVNLGDPSATFAFRVIAFIYSCWKLSSAVVVTNVYPNEGEHCVHRL